MVTGAGPFYYDVRGDDVLELADSAQRFCILVYRVGSAFLYRSDARLRLTVPVHLLPEPQPEYPAHTCTERTAHGR